MVDILSTRVLVPHVDDTSPHGEMRHKYYVVSFSYRGDECDPD